MVFFSLLIAAVGAVGFGLRFTGNDDLLPQITAIPMVVWGVIMAAGIVGFFMFRRAGD